MRIKIAPGVGGRWLSMDMSKGTCPWLAVTMGAWIQWMSACPCRCVVLAVPFFFPQPHAWTMI